MLTYISDQTKLSCCRTKITQVPDGNYGLVVDEKKLEFNGMIGQLQRKVWIFKNNSKNMITLNVKNKMSIVFLYGHYYCISFRPLSFKFTGTKDFTGCGEDEIKAPCDLFKPYGCKRPNPQYCLQNKKTFLLVFDLKRQTFSRK